MVRSLKYCLSLAILGFMFSACQQNFSYYKLDLSYIAKDLLAEQLIEGAGYAYQGSASNMAILKESQRFDPTSALVYQRLGTPYLKRGFPKEFGHYYKKNVEFDAKNWRGGRGYLYLYFYRDYEKALADFDATDLITPNFVDYPQSLSVDYMRAICYHKLNQPRLALAYVDKHIALEDSTIGREYIDSQSFIIRGKSHEAIGNMDQALSDYQEALRIDDNIASILYLIANTYFTIGNITEAKLYLQKAQQSLDRNIIFTRNYVDEFFRLYQSDIDLLEQKIQLVI